MALNNRGLLNTASHHTHTVYIELGAADRQAGRERRRTEDGREGTRGWVGREGARGWSEEAMMRGRVGAGVQEGREG